jgi:FKBP-type peptidyl-prolyl cis-trans isomerase 2
MVNMIEAQLGDRVQVQYFQIPEHSAATDSQSGQKTCEFTVGSSEVPPTLSVGVIGMAPGHRKRLTLQPNEAHGKVQRRLIRQIPRARFPKQMDFQVGKRLTVKDKTTGRRRRVRVVKVNLNSVLLDGNHPLAGKVIELDVVLLSLVSHELTTTARQSLQLFDPGATS